MVLCAIQRYQKLLIDRPKPLQMPQLIECAKDFFKHGEYQLRGDDVEQVANVIIRGNALQPK